MASNTTFDICSTKFSEPTENCDSYTSFTSAGHRASLASLWPGPSRMWSVPWSHKFVKNVERNVILPMPTTTTPARQMLGGPTGRRGFWTPRTNFGPWISFLGLPMDKYVNPLDCLFVCRANRYMCRFRARQTLLNRPQMVMTLEKPRQQICSMKKIRL
jgi:hypothetical protein